MIEDQYLPFLSRVLTPQRLAHSLGAMQTMRELASIYNLDIETAQTIGILHDAAKDLCPDEQQKMILEGNIPICCEAEQNYVLYLHGPVSAYLIQRELGITDELILGAIATHCYFGDNPYLDDPYAWCLRFSDVLEPTRNWSSEPLLLEGVEGMRKAVFAGKMWEGALIMSQTLPRWNQAKGFPVHPNYFEIQRRLAGRVNQAQRGGYYPPAFAR